MTDRQPLTGDELAAIKARAEFCDMEWDRDAGWTCRVHISDATNNVRCLTFLSLIVEDVPRLVAEVERLRAALETIAGDDLDYIGRNRLTDTENAIYVIARDALGRKV